MPRGGARSGAGRPKKPLAEKLIEGNPGRRELSTLKIAPLPAPAGPPEFLKQCGREDDGALPCATEIYSCLTEFIRAAGCENLVAPTLIEDFAHLRRAYLECEYMNRKMGRIANGKRSPYVPMAVDYSKQAMAIFDRIWNIVSQHSEQPYEGKNAFLELLATRGF